VRAMPDCQWRACGLPSAMRLILDRLGRRRVSQIPGGIDGRAAAARAACAAPLARLGSRLPLGSGPRLFPEGVAPGKLSRVACESYENGVLYVAYKPRHKAPHQQEVTANETSNADELRAAGVSDGAYRRSRRRPRAASTSARSTRASADGTRHGECG
jgi:hypothetical protein